MEQNQQSNPLSGLHKQKLYALIAAAVGLIAMFLPWWKVDFGFGIGGASINGMHEIGLLAFLAFIAAGVLTFVMGGDKSAPYQGQSKMIVAGCFAGAALIGLIQFLRQSSYTSFGLYLAILAGVAGAVVVYVLKPEQLK